MTRYFGSIRVFSYCIAYSTSRVGAFNGYSYFFISLDLALWYFNQIPQNIRDHIQSVFQDFPKFQFTSWWVNINNKGNYNVAHTHRGDSDLSVVWYLTDNQSSLDFHHPFSYARHNLNLVIPETYQSDLALAASAGDFIIFPSDVLHSVEQNKFDTPRISLSFNMSFEVN